jgi:cytochrome c-type biogenesis protein CcmH
MPFFWVLAGLLACLSIALVVWPLLTRRATAAETDEARRLAVYRDRRREIRMELESGRLTQQEADRAEQELVAEAAEQFPDVMDLSAPPGPSGRRPALVLAILAALLIPAVALTVYDRVGAPGLIALDAATLRGELTPQRIEQIVRELEGRVARKPDDGEGWAMLAEAFRLKADTARAAEAYGKAIAIGPDNARLLADYAETLVILKQGEFGDEVIGLLDRALKADPDDGKAIAMMGAAQYRAGNLDRALVHLKRLEAGMPEGSPEARRLGETIGRIESERVAQGGSPTVPAPRAVDPQASAGRDGAVISGSITLDDALRDSVRQGMTLFVVARASEGPRIPIAVQRLTVGASWPIRFELSDAQAMNPSSPLSKAGPVIVEARVSQGGDAARRSGDPFGVSAPLRPGARDLTLRIDQRVP